MDRINPIINLVILTPIMKVGLLDLPVIELHNLLAVVQMVHEIGQEDVEPPLPGLQHLRDPLPHQELRARPPELRLHPGEGRPPDGPRGGREDALADVDLAAGDAGTGGVEVGVEPQEVLGVRPGVMDDAPGPNVLAVKGVFF